MASSSSRPASRAASVRVKKDDNPRSKSILNSLDVSSFSRSPVQMQLPPIHLIHAEITAVTSAMRKSNRFSASTSSSSNQQNPSIFQSTSSTALTRGAVHAATIALQGSGGLMEGSQGVERESKRTDSSADQTNSKIKMPSTPLALSMGLRTSQNQSKSEMGREGSGPVGASSPRQDDSPAGLLAGFTILRAQLKEHPDLSTFPLPHLLSPFLRVILSPRTSAPITSAALQAVHKLLLYGLVRPPTFSSSSQTAAGVGAQMAIAEIAHATSHCRFEASDATVDELVLLRILAVMRELICEERADPIPSLKNLGVGNTLTEKELETQEGFKPRPQALADCLGEESICEMMETGMSMCCQMRLSDLLRRTAEQNLTSMIRSLFSRLSSIPTTADEAFNPDPNSIATEPEHATLAADPVGNDAEALNAADEKKLRRMTMPDPKSRAFPAAADVTNPNSTSSNNPLEVLKEMGEAEEREEREKEEAEEGKELLHDGAENEQVKIEGIQEEAPQEVAVEEEKMEGEGEGDAAIPQPFSAPEDVQPYGLPAIKEVLRVLVSLLDPENSQQTDTMRLLGLSMLCSVFEVSGSSLGRFPSLRGIIQDNACRFLFQLTRSENPTLMTYALRTTSTLFETMREHLKLQQEFFLTFLMDKLAPISPVALEPWNEISLSAISAQKGVNDLSANSRAGTPDLGIAGAPPPPPPPPPPMPKSSDRAPAQGEAREQILEAFGLLFRSFDFSPSEDQMVNLWINYDCDTDCENVFESVIRFLCRSVYAANPQSPAVQDSSQILALDAVLSFVSSMTSRQETEDLAAQSATSWPLDYPSIDSLVYRKGRKAAILAGAERFNAKPKDGMAYLEKEGFVDYSGENGISKEKSIATFLKSCPRLDKRLLGDYISRPDNLKVLEAFLSLFDFRDKPVGEAIREMLESFRLPGEAQQIARVTETFAKIYFELAQPAEIASEDAVYVLTYSVIMLNTDLHNKQVKKRMSVEDYRKNLRGVNDGQDFDPEYLFQIYDSIRRREIVMPEEHVGQLGFDFTWKELLRKSRSVGPLLEAHNSAVFDRAMFELAWRPVVAAIAHAFSTFQDEHLLERAISGFRQCAVLASRFGMVDMFDFMLRVLAGATGLLDASLPREMQLQGLQINGTPAATTPNNAVVEVEDQKVTVSPLSVRFGMNFKGQLAAVVLFTIANGNGDAVRHGWAEIFEIFKNLFANSLLPPSMLEMTDFTSETGSVVIPLKPKKPVSLSQDSRAQGGGLFSTLSSYLLSPYSAAQEQPPPEPTEQDVESSLCTIDCVYSCRIEDLYTQIRSLGTEAFLPAIRALRELADRQTIDRLASRAAQSQGNAASSGSSTPTLANGGAGFQGQLPYDPSSLFVLEMLTSITCSSQEALPEAWPLAFEHVSALLNAAKNLHPLLVERAVVSALRLIEVALSLNDEGLRDQSFVGLDLMRSLPNEMRPAVATQLVTGVGRILSSKPSFARSQTEWGLLLALVSDNTSSRNADATRSALDSVRRLLSSKEASEGSVVTVDSFSSFVSLLRDFASAADTSVVREMRESQRRTLTEKKELQSFEEVAQERGTIAVPLLEGLRTFVPSLIESSNRRVNYPEAWTHFWLPLMQSLAQQCVNAHRATRQLAVTHLQRLILAPEVLESSTSNTDSSKPPLFLLFTRVLFPVLNELLKPEVFRRDPTGPNGMQETRMRCCALLSKAFLHYLAQLSDEAEVKKEETNGEEKPDFQTLWLRALDFFDRFLNSGKRDQLTEAIPENLKNLLLVMNASNLLVSPPVKGSSENRSEKQVQLWKVTFERIHRFLPGIGEELFPPAPPAAEVKVVENERTEENVKESNKKKETTA